jgi:N-hydroxyarylamine O-acetyltransferase
MESTPLDLGAYLARIGCATPEAPTLEALGAVHEAHAAAIPFENLDILLGKSILLDLEALQAKLVRARRGGYCFEQNTLFAAALERLGFRVSSLAARVRADGTAVRARTHMLLRVDLDHGPFVADVGFGGNGPVRPLPLQAARESWLGETGYRLRREDELWVLEANVTGDWADLYAFTLEPHYPVDFEMANYFTSTNPRSMFVQTLTAQRSWADKRVILKNRDLTVRRGRDITSEIVRDPPHLLEVLEREFGLFFPPGTRFSKPEF